MTGQGAKNRKEEYLKKREATEDKFYVFILSRDSLDRIIFFNIFFLPIPEKLQNTIHLDPS